jgi:CRP-like cAMP-binding protein
VVSGTIVLSAGGDGSDASVSESCGPGYLIGELTLFVESKRRATATATVASGALEITRSTMVRLLREYPAIGAAVHKRLAERLTETMDDLERVRHTLTAIAD